jgi:hypothetical protein
MSGDLSLGGHSISRKAGRISGGGAGLRAAIGGAVTPFLTLLAGYSEFETSSLTVEMGGMTGKTDSVTLSATSFFIGGRSYTASDFYFEGCVGTLKHNITDELTGEGQNSDIGWLASIGAGKEWVFDSGLSVGLGARVALGETPARDGGDNPKTGHFDFLFSVGYVARE